MFYEPFKPFFNARIWAAVDADGDLPAVDVLEVPLRLGYQPLCREVSDSITERAVASRASFRPSTAAVSLRVVNIINGWRLVGCPLVESDRRCEVRVSSSPG